MKTNKLVIGTAQFGLKYGISNTRGKVNFKEIKRILDYAQLNKIQFIDTAKSYGDSEKIIGSYIKDSNSKWNIITKFDSLKVSIIDQLNDSKNKLNTTPYAVLAHSCELFISEFFQNEAPELLIENPGLKIGVSLYNEIELKKVLDCDFKPSIIQIPLNILDNKLYLSGALSELKKNKIEIHARSLFLQGLLYLNPNDLDMRFSDVKSVLLKLKSIAKSDNLSLAEISLLWVNNIDDIDHIVIGLENRIQLQEQIKSLKKNYRLETINSILSQNYDNNKILNPSLWS